MYIHSTHIVHTHTYTNTQISACYLQRNSKHIPVVSDFTDLKFALCVLHADLKVRLESIDAKFKQQAQELECMRERLQYAESGQHEALARGRLLEKQQRELLEDQRRRRMDTTPHTQVSLVVLEIMWI